MEIAMMQNMEKKTGKKIDNWTKIVRARNFNTRSEAISFLKKKHSVGHFYAHLIAKQAI
tara:strand:- start:472 stop:648 length:177 start_codon:yes stop_codon:yes gene_type:complete